MQYECQGSLQEYIQERIDHIDPGVWQQLSYLDVVERCDRVGYPISTPGCYNEIIKRA